MNPHLDSDDLNNPLEDLIPEKDKTRDGLPFGVVLPLDEMFPPQPEEGRAREAFPFALGLLFRKSGEEETVPIQEIL
eukprot:15173662-Ditylum_brightwellii.AAC.1